MNRQEQAQRRVELGRMKRGIDRTVPFLIKYAIKRKIPIINPINPSPHPFCFLIGAFLVLDHINISKGSLALIAHCVHCDRRSIHRLLATEVTTLPPGGIDGNLCRTGTQGFVPLPFLLKESPCILTPDEFTADLADREGDNISKYLLSTVKLVKTLKRCDEGLLVVDREPMDDMIEQPIYAWDREGVPDEYIAIDHPAEEPPTLTTTRGDQPIVRETNLWPVLPGGPAVTDVNTAVEWATTYNFTVGEGNTNA